MKRLVFMAVMVAFILGTVGMAQAVEIKAQGDWQMSVNYIKNPNLDKDLDDDPFQAVQRFRTIFEFIANENLKGVVRFNTNTLRSGANAGRGSLDIGTRNDVWDLDVAHLDFMIPNTQVNVKAGLQPVALPNTLGAHILDDNVWAFTASSQFNDMLGLTVGWARLADFKAGGVDTTGDGLIDSKNKDEVDMFMAIVPVTMDGFQINPFMAYARLGKNALNDDVDADGDPDYTDGNYETSNLFHAGINFTVDMFDPIKIMGDFNYGSMSKYYDDGANRTDVGATAGWIADLAVAYQMDMMTPMIFGLYESGESSSSFREDKKGKIMPNVLSPANAGISSFGFGR
ncbi:MAG: outer membrane homotrimeric porin, partial [Desulfonatronovibrionaceae bacterium]